MKAAVLIPCHGDPKLVFAASLAMMTQRTARERPDIEVGLLTVSSPRLPRSRNMLVQQAKEWGADVALWLDADIMFPADTLLRLIDRNLDVVGANCPMRADRTEPTVRQMDGTLVYRSKGVEQIGWIGAAALLTRMSVYEKIPQPYFAFESDELGEDHFFCRRLHAAGIPIHVDHEIDVGHVHQTVLTHADVSRHQSQRDAGYVLTSGRL